MSGLILPPGVTLDDDGPSERPGPPCAVCGEPMPAFTEEQWTEYERLTKVRRVVLRHDTCPRDVGKAITPDRRFEARVRIVEVSLAPGATDATVVELAGFTAYTDAPNLDAAMRPLALHLGEKWQEVEEVAHIADAPPEPEPPVNAGRVVDFYELSPAAPLVIGPPQPVVTLYDEVQAGRHDEPAP